MLETKSDSINYRDIFKKEKRAEDEEALMEAMRNSSWKNVV
jgi:hypothetical protein